VVAEVLPAAFLAALGGVRSVGVISGAGVSKASGLRTYRGQGGVYDDPVEGDRTVEALSGPTLRSDPERTWETVLRLARKAHAAGPGPAHLALAALEAEVEEFVLLTQNVDGLHARAGSRNVIEIHGNVFRTRCEGCGRVDALPEASLTPRAPRPPCAGCGDDVRPDVVLFGEALPFPESKRLHDELRVRSPDLVVLVGTSALFPYIVEPAVLATRRGRLTLEVNPEETDATPAVRHVVRAPAEVALPALLDALRSAATGRRAGRSPPPPPGSRARPTPP
jgi:NAD-dependent deacetylase